MNKIIPIIDLFAGPGGLSEGFSAYKNSNGHPFKVKLSIEKDAVAHQTLLLRNFFRQFPSDAVPTEYYQYLRRKITRNELMSKYKVQASQAESEAWCAELGSKSFPDELVDERIEKALGAVKPKHWLLIGGPPCQAYSLVGRSRMKGLVKYKKDKRHFLYKEYLRVIAQHKPSVFIMENVKGLLSSTVKGENIFQRIIADLKDPFAAIESNKKQSLNYKIYSLVKPVDDPELHEPADFIIESEKFGIPQARHRVILLGIRSDLEVKASFLQCKESVPMRSVISDLPKLRSVLSRENDSNEAWIEAIAGIKGKCFSEINDNDLKKVLLKNLNRIEKRSLDRGADYSECSVWPRYKTRWYYDPRLKGVCNHMSRGHMKEDLYRYFFAACFAKFKKRSPKMADFPVSLLPKHKNVLEAVNGNMFTDRFKVQVTGRPSSTITSHISKDGHYFIHPDPCQCRSLTVREAARLQTFPDNYFFEGNRTQQYHQVGNAVPPMLARQVAEVVHEIFKKIAKL